MKKEDKELLYKALCSYLPYKLLCKVIDQGNPTTSILNAVFTGGECCFHGLVESDHGFESIKPILKPLSMLTEEHSKNCGYNHLPLFIEHIRSKEISVLFWYDLLNNGWDVYDLIPKGLAEEPEKEECKHEHVTREDGCDECQDCGTRNY